MRGNGNGNESENVPIFERSVAGFEFWRRTNIHKFVTTRDHRVSSPPALVFCQPHGRFPCEPCQPCFRPPLPAPPGTPKCPAASHCRLLASLGKTRTWKDVPRACPCVLAARKLVHGRTFGTPQQRAWGFLLQLILLSQATFVRNTAGVVFSGETARSSRSGMGR